MNPSLPHRPDKTLALLGLVLSLPAVYFFTGSFLKYEMNLLPNAEILVPPPVVMIGGLLVAMILNLFSLFRTKVHEASLTKRLRSKLLNVMVAGLALLFLILLLGYVLAENLTESHTSSTYIEKVLST